jgi:glycosyltransferase involved in cell wall biosynthesis
MSNDKQIPRYSVLLPVYRGDKADWLKIAVDSMLAQTLPPGEIVIAVDGPIDDELDMVIAHYKTSDKDLFTIYKYERNEGLGKLLYKTLPLCRNEYIARMDADDYSLPRRMEKQFAAITKNTDINVVGTNVDEFNGDISNVVAHVVLPETPEEVYSFAKKRCPVRHPTLLYKKSEVIAAGNYTPTQINVQDYDLVVKLLLHGYKIYNIQEPLVKMRVLNNFYKRRGGVRYLKLVHEAKKRFYKTGFLSWSQYIVSFYGQAMVILMPGKLREFIYMKLLRS